MSDEDKKYIKGEEFLEVSFELPNIYTKDNLAKEIMEHFKYAVNIRLVDCKMFVDPSRLSVSEDTHCVTVYNYKQVSQIIEKENKE